MFFADVLRAKMLSPPGYTPGLVSHLSGVPKATIVNWLEGRVARPRRWQDLVRVADAMRLNRHDTDELLVAGRHPTLAELTEQAVDEDRALLAGWPRSWISGAPVGATLPHVATPFLGRSEEVTSLVSLITDPAVRAVTLTGFAGAGKTRLAIEVADVVADRFRNGVAYVPLAQLTDPALVPELIAQALGLDTERGDGMLDQVATRHQLVVLDNFEHVLAAIPAVAELMAQAPELTFLITSRAVLHLYGEHRFEVAPLPVPDEGDASAAENPAVTLFVQRARAVDPSFQLDSGNVDVVGEICRRLDGLPLSIELAAARITVLTPAGLLGRLAHRLGVLVGGARDLPARHQSLEATLDWSLDQLDTASRHLFAQLSVYMSGCRLDGAEAVGTFLESDEVLDSLMVLVDHSLVRTQTIGDGQRFVMLETVRSYAESQLTEHESDVAHERALIHVAAIVAEVAQRPNEAEPLDRIAEELDNIRALMRWSFDHDRADVAATVVSSLLPFWLRRGPLREGQLWLDLALRQPGQLPSDVLAATRYGAGRVARQLGEFASAAQHFHENLIGYERTGDEIGRARVLGALGVIACDTDDLDGAEALHRESLGIHRRHDDRAGVAVALTNLGEVARRRRHADDAVTLQGESASLFAVIGDVFGEAAALTKLAASQIDLGSIDDAQGTLTAAVRLWHRAGEPSGLAECLELFAAVAAHRGEPERGVRLAAAATAMRRGPAVVRPPAEAAGHDEVIEQLRRSIDATRFSIAWREGSVMSASEALAVAHDAVADPTRSSPIPPRRNEDSVSQPRRS